MAMNLVTIAERYPFPPIPYWLCLSSMLVAFFYDQTEHIRHTQEHFQRFDVDNRDYLAKKTNTIPVASTNVHQ